MREDLTPPDLNTWRRVFNDRAYWQQSPDEYYIELLRLADDLLGMGAIDLDQWQDLNARAAQSLKNSPAINVAREIDDHEAGGE